MTLKYDVFNPLKPMQISRLQLEAMFQKFQ